MKNQKKLPLSDIIVDGLLGRSRRIKDLKNSSNIVSKALDSLFFGVKTALGAVGENSRRIQELESALAEQQQYSSELYKIVLAMHKANAKGGTDTKLPEIKSKKKEDDDDWNLN